MVCYYANNIFVKMNAVDLNVGFDVDFNGFNGFNGFNVGFDVDFNGFDGFNGFNVGFDVILHCSPHTSP